MTVIQDWIQLGGKKKNLPIAHRLTIVSNNYYTLEAKLNTSHHILKAS